MKVRKGYAKRMSGQVQQKKLCSSVINGVSRNRRWRYSYPASRGPGKFLPAPTPATG